MGPTRFVDKPDELLGNPVLERGVNELEVFLQRILHVLVTEVLARFLQRLSCMAAMIACFHSPGVKNWLN